MGKGQAATLIDDADAMFQGQQLGDTIDWMVGNSADHRAQIGLGIEAIELGGFDERVSGVGALERRARTRALADQRAAGGVIETRLLAPAAAPGSPDSDSSSSRAIAPCPGRPCAAPKLIRVGIGQRAPGRIRRRSSTDKRQFADIGPRLRHPRRTPERYGFGLRCTKCERRDQYRKPMVDLRLTLIG